MLAADQCTKLLALNFLSPHSSVPILPGIFHLTLVFNTGISFGLFQNYPFILLILITLSLILLFFWSHQMKDSSGLAQWGLVLILGGAIGNWIDRIRIGAVVDFLDFQIWPVFNVADSSITIGVMLYLILFLFKREKLSST